MCLICIDWQKGKLTVDEALRNLGETLKIDDPHFDEVVLQLLEKEKEDAKT